MDALTRDDRLLLIRTAREAISAALDRRAPAWPPAAGSAALAEPCGAFVTLRTADGELRGCIGHVTAAEPLLHTVREVAVASAFDDPRFPPLRPEEWEGCRLEVSVLSPLARVDGPSAVRPGVHGVKVRQGFRVGLLLPQVATEQGWDRDTFLSHACRKAGLPPEAWRDPATVIEVFTAVVVHEPGSPA